MANAPPAISLFIMYYSYLFIYYEQQSVLIRMLHRGINTRFTVKSLSSLFIEISTFIFMYLSLVPVLFQNLQISSFNKLGSTTVISLCLQCPLILMKQLSRCRQHRESRQIDQQSLADKLINISITIELSLVDQLINSSFRIELHLADQLTNSSFKI